MKLYYGVVLELVIHANAAVVLSTDAAVIMSPVDAFEAFFSCCLQDYSRAALLKV